MPTLSDQHLVHRLQIDLMDDTQLSYVVLPSAKKVLEEWIRSVADNEEDHPPGNHIFLRFDAAPLRYVYIRITAIKKLIFLWDAPGLIEDPLGYIDNFDVIVKDIATIPDAIIVMHGNSVPIVYWELDMEDDYFNVDDDYNLDGLTFIRISDMDGEENYIPVANIDILEITRSAVFPDDGDENSDEDD